MPGITATGFEAKRQEDIKLDLENDFKENISPTINTSSASVAGQLIGIFSSALAAHWELVAEMWTAQQVANAEGFNLDNLLALLGVGRTEERFTRVTLTLNLNAGITVPSGSTVQVGGDESIQVTTVADVTNAGGSPANVTVTATCTLPGPVRANAATVTVIVDTVPGWNTCTNPNDADPGAFAESDAEYRARYRADIFRTGSTSNGAIRTHVFELTGMQQVTVFSNDTDLEDANGLPPHSIEVVVFDGIVPVCDDDDIAQAILDRKAGGIGTFGTDSGTATDELGNTHTVYFSRTTIVPIYLEIDITTDPVLYPETGDEAVGEAVAAFGDTSYKTGGNVILSKLNAPTFTVPGVKDVTGIRVGIAADPAQTTNYVIGNRELASLDTARTLVTSTPSTEE